MSERRVIVCLPSGTGGRRGCIDDQLRGAVDSGHDLIVFLQSAGLAGWDEWDVVEWGWIGRHEGGPGGWGH